MLKKKFGQHWLVNKILLKKIVSFLNIEKSHNNILEIGPGIGAITETILNNSNTNSINNSNKRYYAVEIDKDITKILIKKFRKEKKLEIINKNILHCDINLLGDNINVIGSLPYNTSKKIIDYITNFNNVRSAYFIIQKEVAEVISAIHGTKKYGKFSIIIQNKCIIKILINKITPDNFYPKPKVNSSFIKIIPKKIPLINNVYILKKIIFTLFNKRRKMIKNSIKNNTQLYNLIKSSHIPLNKRPEDISLKEFARIIN